MNPSTGNKNSRRTPLKLILIIGAIILLTQLSTLIFSPNPEKDAWGKIILPRSGDRAGNQIIVVGETQDIASGQFIWIVLEYSSIDCSPVKRVLRNTRFRTTIIPALPPDTFKLSLFVVDKTRHQQWSEWSTQSNDAPLSCPSEKRRLDAIELTNNLSDAEYH